MTSITIPVTNAITWIIMARKIENFLYLETLSEICCLLNSSNSARYDN